MTEVDHETESAVLQGGLIRPERRHMPTLFTLILWWWLAVMSATVLVPYLLTRHTDDEPTGKSLIFFSLIALASTVHGTMAYYGAYRKGGKIRDFFLGAVLMPLAFPLIAYLNRNEPDRFPEQPKGLMRALDRFTFAMGNIWFGIAQILVMIGFLLRATVYETEFADKGNEAAYASFYNHPLMGLLCVLFFITIYCATMRKYPFRVHQVGWLTVHTGLLMLMIGCMMMYWGSVYGIVRLWEGESASRIEDQDIREIEITIPSMQYKKSHRVTVDYDTEVEDVHQIIPITAEMNGRKENYEVEIDRYFARAEYYRDLVPADDSAPAAVKLKLEGPGFSDEQFLIAGGTQSSFELSILKVYLQSERSDVFVDSIGYEYGEDERRRGQLTVKKDGKVVTQLPITLGDFSAAELAQGRSLATSPVKVGNHTIHVDRYYDFMERDDAGQLYDAMPNESRSPGLSLRILGENGEALVPVSSYFAPNRMSSTNVYGYEFEYEVMHEIPMPSGMVLITRTPTRSWTVVIGTNEGVRCEPIDIGKRYRFSSEAPFTFTVMKALDHGKIEEGVRASQSRNTFRAVRCRVRHGDASESTYLYQEAMRPSELMVGDKVVQIRYQRRPIKLPFTLSLLDFRHFEYANSQKAERFETNIVLRDEQEGVREAVLVDMNHPLTWRGYSFFNGSPLFDDTNGRRGVLLQVNVNPGLVVILVSSTLITLGIIIVFFYKEKIRRWDRRRKEAAQAA